MPNEFNLTMCREEDRLNSFRIDSDLHRGRTHEMFQRLAARGYYFNACNGRVQCFGCGHTPEQEHHETCPQDQFNIPSQQTARLNLTMLAARGYYFNAYNGRVQCFGCGHTPEQEHHETCPQDQFNIPSQLTARLNLTMLAARGYYFNTCNGRVQCFGCGHTPEQEHHETCPQDQFNIPIQQTARLNLTMSVDPHGLYNTCVYIRRHTDKN